MTTIPIATATATDRDLDRCRLIAHLVETIDNGARIIRIAAGMLPDHAEAPVMREIAEAMAKTAAAAREQIA